MKNLSQRLTWFFQKSNAMKINCPDSVELQDYLDHNLSVEQRKDCEQHLKNCADCRQRLATFTRLYQAGGDYAAQQISVKPSPRQIESIMSRISFPDRKKQDSAKNDFISLFWANFKWLFAPAFVLIFTAIFLLLTKSGPENIPQPRPFAKQFDLQANVVEPIFDPGTILKTGGDQQIKLSEFSRVPLNCAVQLPKDAMILIRIADSQMKLNDEAVFSFGEKEMKLAAGHAVIELKNPHSGFIIKTPFAEVTPLGTRFSIEVKKHFIKIELEEGQIAITGKSGINRVLSKPGHVFVNPDGQFSNRIPQAQSNPTASEDRPEIHNHQAPIDNGSPQRILDSF